MAATHIMFVGNGLSWAVKSTRIMPVPRGGGQFPIYATTPSRTIWHCGWAFFTTGIDGVFVVDILKKRKQAFEQRNRGRWATVDVQIDRKDRRNTADASITAGKHAAVASTVAD